MPLGQKAAVNIGLTSMSFHFLLKSWLPWWFCSAFKQLVLFFIPCISIIVFFRRISLIQVTPSQPEAWLFQLYLKKVLPITIFKMPFVCGGGGKGPFSPLKTLHLLIISLQCHCLNVYSSYFQQIFSQTYRLLLVTYHRGHCVSPTVLPHEP